MRGLPNKYTQLIRQSPPLGSRLLVTDTGRMCCDLGPMSETPGALASLPLMDPLIGDNPKTLPMVEPLD